ncbi:MAG: universal stress protein [Planctomycetota bacterium]
MTIRHILLTTDLSSESLHPCLSVAELARTFGAKITLLHVVHEIHIVPTASPMAVPIAPLDVDKEVKHAELTLADQKLVLGDELDVETAVVTHERVHEAVAVFAKRHDVDLIALSTHGRTGFRHFALGSVAEAVLRHSPVPVLCFPRSGD